MSKPKTKAAPKAKPIPKVKAESTAITLANSMVGVIDRARESGNTDVVVMRAMLDMQMELVRDQRRVEFNTSMSDAQALMEPVVRRDAGEKKKYAKLERIDAEIRPIYTKAGFTLSFNSKKMEDGAILMKCKCLHRSGHVEEYELEGNLDTGGAKGNVNKTDIQGLGSSVSYLRRYLTCMIFNVVLTDEDNDGKGVIGGKKADEFGSALGDSKKKTPPPAKGKVIDADYEDVQKWDGNIWDGDESGEPMRFTGEPKAVLKKSGQHLMTVIMKVKKKEARSKLISDNTALMRALDDGGMGDLVISLHELVDKGAA